VQAKQHNQLSDTELLLLLDMCLSAEQKCDERLAEAIRTFQGTRLSYLQQLKRHYAELRQNFLDILHERGRTEAEIQHQLKLLPERDSLEL
jgi:hypothetical protein